MSSAYDQQIKQLVDHIQTLNQALHERNMQIVHWQQVARAVQDERARLARGLMDQVKTSLGAFSTRFQGLRTENKKLRAYIEHQKQLHESVARDLQGQLQYALARIDELARERSDWRGEVSVTRQAALKYQQQVAEQKGVINSQQAALTELRHQLSAAQGFAEVEERLRAESEHLEHELERVLNELHTQDALVAARDRELRSVQEAFEAFRAKANEEVAALNQELGQHRNQVVNTDERVDELTSLLANSEREVVNLHKSLGLEREKLRTVEVQLETAQKEVTNLKRKATKAQREATAAKADASSKELATMMKQIEALSKSNEDLKVANKRLQDEMTDKTQYMQAIEGQKGKLRAVKPPAEGGQGQ